MKALKIVVGVFLLLIVLVSAGLYLFLKTFDVNKFLPQITAQAAQMTGRELKVGRAEIGLSFSNGISLQVKDIVLADDPKFSDKPFLAVDRIDVGLNLGVLIFERKMQLANVVIVSPQVVVIRSKEGLINAATIGRTPAAASPASASSVPTNPAAALPAFLVKDIKVVHAHVTYIDQMFTPPLALKADRIDVDIRDLSLTGPFTFTVKAALFSVEQNVRVDGQALLDILKQSASIKQMNIQADLATFDVARLEHELPMLKAAALKKLEGMVKLSFPDMQVSAAGLASLKGRAIMDKGFVLSALFPVPIEDIQLEADLDERNINVNAFSYTLAEGTDNGTALVSDYLAHPAVAVTFDAKAINVKALAEGYKVPVTISGLLSATGELKFSGKSPEEMFSSLSGRVKGELKNGVLENMNLIALGLDSIPMLPGLLDSVMLSLPSETQDEVKKGITRFETCKVEAHVVNGLMTLDTADITTRDLAVHAAGTLRLVQDLSIQADIRIEKQLSVRLVEKVKKLSYLEDAEGRIYLPMTLSGPLMKPVVMPDMDYLTKKLVLAVGGEELQKALGGSPAAAEAVGAIFDLFRKK